MRIMNDIISKEVLDSSATILGKIVDVEIDSSNNIIESIVIINSTYKSFRKNNSKELIIPFEMIGKIGDKIILKKDITETLGL